MSTFRTYFSKSNNLISNNVTNSAMNPVTEISYGTFNKEVSRHIFDADLTKLRDRISQNFINPNQIVKHVLHMTNTISYAPQYIGRRSYSTNINRASSFNLDLFNINQDWDEGSGYDFNYNNTVTLNSVEQASNWYSARTTTLWDKAGLYESGVTTVIASQRFDKGNENIDIDITDYINDRLNNIGTSYGLGIKFPDAYEDIEIELRQAIAFHAKNTNTWYEPYIETTVNDTITDDRNYFYLDKDNDLYLYMNMGGVQQDITINEVNIYNQDDEMVDTVSGSSIVNVSRGIYKITLNISSEDYPDAVLFRDEWMLTINGRDTKFDGEFYLISQDKYYTFDNSSQINMNNYNFYFWGIGENENIIAGGIKKINLTIKELYSNQNEHIPLEIEYRLFTTVGSKYEVNVIPFTPVNRTNSGYYFNLDTSWLIPQDYFLQIRLKNGNYSENKQTLSFTVVSDGIILV